MDEVLLGWATDFLSNLALNNPLAISILECKLLLLIHSALKFERILLARDLSTTSCATTTTRHSFLLDHTPIVCINLIGCLRYLTIYNDNCYICTIFLTFSCFLRTVG